MIGGIWSVERVALLIQALIFPFFSRVLNGSIQSDRRRIDFLVDNAFLLRYL